jgi:hypothetical protein
MTEETKARSASMVESGAAIASSSDLANPTSRKDKKKNGPPPDVLIKPKPKLSKKERRDMQEQQRAAKAAKQQQQQQQQNPSKTRVGTGQTEPSKPTAPQQPQVNKNSEETFKNDCSLNSNLHPSSILQDNSLGLFSHLPQYRGTCQLDFYEYGRAPL